MLVEELSARSQRDARRYEKKSSAFESLRAQNIDLREALEREQKAREGLEMHYKGRVEELNMALQVAVEEFAKEGLDYTPSGELVRTGRGGSGWEGASAPPWQAAGSSGEGARDPAAGSVGAGATGAVGAAAAAAASPLEARSIRSGGSKGSGAARHQHRVTTLPPAVNSGSAAAFAALRGSAPNPALRKRAVGGNLGSSQASSSSSSAGGGGSGGGSGGGGSGSGGRPEGESYHSAEEE